MHLPVAPAKTKRRTSVRGSFPVRKEIQCLQTLIASPRQPPPPPYDRSSRPLFMYPIRSTKSPKLIRKKRYFTLERSIQGSPRTSSRRFDQKLASHNALIESRP